MKTTESLSSSLADFNKMVMLWQNNILRYQLSVKHNLLGTYIDEFERFYNLGSEACLQLVDLLKRQDAFANHGLGEGQYSPPIQLLAAIKNNEVQFQHAIDLQRNANPVRLIDLIVTIENAEDQLAKILTEVETLSIADWQPATATPTDAKLKWVYLTKRQKFTYLEKNAYFDPKENKWVLDGLQADENFEIIEWLEPELIAPNDPEI